MPSARKIVVVGGSAGGIDALSRVLEGVSADIPAALLIVVHMARTAPSALTEILGRVARLPVETARDGAALEAGHAYVAPPDAHLLVEEGAVRLSHGPRENHHRPAADPLFRAAARAFGPRAIGVILSGNLDDGAAGLHAIHRAGGITIVQSPEDALFRGMPSSAIETSPIDHVVPASEIGALLYRLARAEPRSRTEERTLPIPEVDEIPAGGVGDLGGARTRRRDGPPSEFVCPDCGGTLYELTEGGLERFRCRVGHGYSLESLNAIQQERIEDALWYSLRTLQEHGDTSRRAAVRARAQGLDHVARAYEERAGDSDRQAESVRSALVKMTSKGGRA